MLIIGLTGGIGSGKSTVAQLFAEFHIPIIDADKIARDLTKPGEQAYTSIQQYFGDTILLSNKELNRSLLREIIFKDDSSRQWLENLLHPLIITAMLNQIN